MEVESIVRENAMGTQRRDRIAVGVRKSLPEGMMLELGSNKQEILSG